MPTSIETEADRARRQQALELIARGEKIQEIARRVQRHRMTIYRWKREFQAARSITADR
jgi:transposase